MTADGTTVNPGDQVRQIALIGLCPLEGDPYVRETEGATLVLSRTPNGPPLTDLHGQPRHYPAAKFRRVA